MGSVAEPTVASTDDLPMDPYFAILDGLQAGLSDEAMMRQLGVSKEDIQQVRQLLLTPIGDTEHSPVNG
ncbi:hypothetical protein GCM10025857_03690 [Alicyclobacillus contaminans]|nr:hypothetical protein GCM10025857_03690 [Alicyclobacillus contaminans]